jgi:hypothetical protein
MRSPLRTLTCVLSLALLATPALAQDAPARDGFFIGFGFGGGGGEVSGAPDAEGGTGWLTLGGTLSQKVRLAGDFNGFAQGEDSDLAVATSTLSVLFYPTVRSNFFLKGGIGIASASYTGPGPDAYGAGFGSLLGAGYDIRLGKNFSITPQFTIFGGQTGDLKNDDGDPVLNDVSFGIATLSIGVVFH